MVKSGLFIMGGSSYYTLLLLKSLKQQGILDGLTKITLFGRNIKRLSLMATKGQALINHPLEIDYTDRFEDCLSEDYHLIFNQIRFGGMSSRDRDEKIALEIGLPADETIGIVGVSNAIRTIIGAKRFLDILKQKTSPYTLINFTNPCSILSQYITQYYQIPVVGVCDYPHMMKVKISHALNLDIDELNIRYFGLNHFGFIYSIEHQGKQLLDQVLDLDLDFKPECNRFFRTLLNISWRYVFERRSVLQQQKQSTNRASQLLQIEQNLDALATMPETSASQFLSLLEKRNCDWFDLVVSPLFSSLLAMDTHDQILNFTTSDIFDIGLPQTVIESNCPRDGGCFSIKTPPLAIRQSVEFSLVKQLKKSEQTLLQGILDRDGKKIIQSCLSNPMIGQLDKISRYFEILCAKDSIIHSMFRSSQPGDHTHDR